MGKPRVILAGMGLALSLWAASCSQPLPRLQPTPWVYSDLRLLDAADNFLPSADLTAVYVRTLEEELQFRLEWLEHSILPDYDLYLTIDHSPGGTDRLPISSLSQVPWDILLVIPASGPLQVLDMDYHPRQGSALRVLRDPLSAILTISLRKELLSAKSALFPTFPAFAFQVFLTPPGSPEVVEQVGPLSSEEPPPPPASVLLAFWNSYPAYTPALALRRWDGAHTGPFGGRHGLFNLLRTARSAETPLTLLDLRNPASLSALAFAGYLPLVQEMTAGGWLNLPRALPDPAFGPAPMQDWASQRFLAENSALSAAFGLPESQLMYSPSGPIAFPASARLIFTKTQNSQGDDPLKLIYPVRWRDKVILSLPVYPTTHPETQPTPEGLPLSVRRALVNAALSARHTPGALIHLGGDLPTSAWGDPQSARAAFRYLNSRPWIRFLDAQSLLTLPAPDKTIPLPFTPLPVIESDVMAGLSKALQRAPNNPASQSAWDALLALYSPVSTAGPDLQDLRRGYLGLVWSLLEAAYWAENPVARSTCSLDPDRDGQPECILSNQRVYLQVEIESGVIAFAFFRKEHQGEMVLHQVIGPSSQLITGLSDPASWDLSQGLLADPAVIPGSFRDSGYLYRIGQVGPQLVLHSLDGSVRKTIQIGGNGGDGELLSVSYRFANLSQPFSSQISLLVDAWQRFTPTWVFQDRPPEVLQTVQGWRWLWTPPHGSRRSFGVELTSSAALSIITFADSREFLAITENPNRDYPPGHFLPIPLTLGMVSSTDAFQVSLRLTNP